MHAANMYTHMHIYIHIIYTYTKTQDICTKVSTVEHKTPEINHKTNILTFEHASCIFFAYMCI